jgi:hypothetical protein
MAEQQQPKTHILSVDCITDGAGGPCFWIAAVVANKKDAKEEKVYFNGIVYKRDVRFSDQTTQLYVALYASECLKRDESDKRRPIVYETYGDLYNAFWKFYERRRAYCDVVHDTLDLAAELMFFRSIQLNPPERKDNGPCPLLNIDSMVHAGGKFEGILRDDLIKEKECSLIPKGWVETTYDPMYNALRTLSIYLFLMKSFPASGK